MSNELQNNSALSWDFLDDDAPASAPFLKFKQGQYFCAPLTGDKEVDLTGSLFVAAMPTFRQTLTAWSDAQKAPVEQYSAYLALGQKLPSQRTDYPIRANGQDAWQDGFAIDGMLLVAGAWKQASYTAGTVTSNIALRQAMQGVRQLMGRTYRPDDWSPVWELGKHGELKAKSGTMVKTPNLVLLGLVNKDVETAGTQPGLTRSVGNARGSKRPSAVRPANQRAVYVAISGAANQPGRHGQQHAANAGVRRRCAAKPKRRH